jgi:hypothetical protein
VRTVGSVAVTQSIGVQTNKKVKNENVLESERTMKTSESYLRQSNGRSGVLKRVV